MNRQLRAISVLAFLLALSTLVSGCALFGAAESTAQVDAMTNSPMEGPALEVESRADGDVAMAEEGLASGAPSVGSDFGGGEMDASKAEVGGAAAAIVPLPTSVNNIPDQQFQADLSAGEINDNKDFAEYLQYRTDYLRFVGASTVFDRDVSERHVIAVTSRNGLPVLGAEVLVYQGQELIATFRTPATGLVYFFPKAFSNTTANGIFSASVSKGQSATSFTLTRGQLDSFWPVTLDVAATRPPIQLDVLFLLDATGSMADEIDQLKENILSISAQIEALPGRPDVRFGMVTYRDRGDDYITRTYDFTANVNAFQQDLRDVYAGGGGDTPESLNEGLHDAIWDVSWRVDNTVSLIFLVADAPPHLDYAQDYAYDAEAIHAASLGIKILPISSEMPDEFYQSQAEYVFRQLGVFTGGSFIFLTYDSMPQSDGEAGRDDVSVDENRYSVEDLDALVVRLIQEELAALTTAQQ